MKLNKKIKKTILFILIGVIVVGGLVYVGVGKVFANTIYNSVTSRVSEARYNVFVGENDKIEINVMSGVRESDYIVNGYSTENIDFGLITILIKDNAGFKLNEPKYIITIDAKRYDGTLQKNPYNGSYVADIKTIIDNGSVVTVKFVDGEISEEIKLELVNKDWKVDYKNALKIAVNALKKDVEAFIVNNEFQGECYIKIISDAASSNNKEYFWYVNFVGRNGKSIAVIIHPQTKEILAKKV